jgi:hypothetical protein
VATQKTKLYYDLDRLLPSQAAAAPDAESARSMARTQVDPDAEARAKAGEVTPVVHEAQRGSRILRIADFLPERLQSARRKPALAQTRVRPIEQLLASVRDEDVEDDEDLRATTAMTERPPPLSGSGTRKLEVRRSAPRKRRRKLLLGAGLIALLALILGGLAALRNVGGLTRAPRANPAVAEPAAVPAEPAFGPPPPPPARTAGAKPQVAAPSAAERPRDAEPTRAEKRARARARRSERAVVAPADDPLERKAVDALAGGDYAGALRSYEALARQHPERPVYAEVARILRQRIEKAKQR